MKTSTFILTLTLTVVAPAHADLCEPEEIDNSVVVTLYNADGKALPSMVFETSDEPLYQGGIGTSMTVAHAMQFCKWATDPIILTETVDEDGTTRYTAQHPDGGLVAVVGGCRTPEITLVTFTDPREEMNPRIDSNLRLPVMSHN